MQDFLFFREGKKFTKINLAEIIYVHADKRYIMIITTAKCFFSHVSISHVEKILPGDLFCRVHRSYIISLKHTDAFDSELAYLGNKKIPIAEQYKNVLRNGIAAINGRTGPFTLEKGEVDKLLEDLNP